MEQLGSPLLCEFHVETFKLTGEQRLKIIQGLYDLILKDDPLWHFFCEDELGDIIRCSPQFSDKLKELLDETGFNYVFNDTWIESIQQVVENPEYFANIFHINSELAINKKLEYKDLCAIIDRFSHSLFLASNFANKNNYTERTVLSDVLISRAFYDGMRFQYISNKKFMEKLKDGDKD